MSFQNYLQYASALNLTNIGSLSGDPKVGSALSVLLHEGWSYESIQWIRIDTQGNRQEIPGQTSDTYVVVPSDIGFYITADLKGISCTASGQIIQ